MSKVGELHPHPARYVRFDRLPIFEAEGLQGRATGKGGPLSQTRTLTAS
jgi:hypothetical protein